MATSALELNQLHPRYALGALVHQNSQGRGLEFREKPWLVHIYKDESAHLVIVKASQVGITEFALVDMFWLAGQGVAGLYVLPTDLWRSTFVPNRVDRVLDHVKAYQPFGKRGFTKTDAVTQKTIRKSNWKFVGSHTKGNFFEFPAGCITIDEYNLCDQENLLYAEDRLGADPTGGRTRKFGNPTVDDVGISVEFEESDQKHWFVRCGHCGEDQVLGWWTHFVDESGHVPKLRDPDGNPVCQKCEKPFDRLGKGQWVAKHPGREVSGYQVSKLFADSRADVPVIRKLLKTYLGALKNFSELQRFYNNDLGLPYSAEGVNVTAAMLANCAGDKVMPAVAEGTVAGCDVGSVLHLHISKRVNGKREKVFIGTVRDFDELEFVCKVFGVTSGVIDGMPEQHKVRDFCNRNPQWLACYYGVASPKEQRPDYVKHTISRNRTESLDASYQDIALGNVVVPVNWRQIDNGDFLKQMVAPKRVFDPKMNKGAGAYVWDEGTRADHHRHADNYEKIAADTYGGDFIGGFV